MNKFANSFFAPGHDSVLTTVGLLVMRIWFGGAMLLLHGWGKLTSFSDQKDSFASVFGLPPAVSLVIAIFAEVVCSALLICGLVSRIAALFLAGTMFIAFTVIHGGSLSGSNSGEMAAIYLGAFAVLTAAGPGRLSVDGMLFKRPQ